MLKDLLAETLQKMLEAEMDETLGYSKFDYKNKNTDDSRNGYSQKTVTSSMGELSWIFLEIEKANMSLRLSRRTKPIYPALRIRFSQCMPRV